MYEGRHADPLFPARYPLRVWARLEPQPAQVAARDFPDTFDEPRLLDHVEREQFEWHSVARHALLVDDGVIVNADGSVNQEKTKAMRDAERQSSELVPDLFIEAPDGTLKPRPRASGVRGYLLAGGVTSLVVGLGVWFRRRGA